MVGHGPNDPGAVNKNGETEYKYNTRVKDKLVEILSQNYEIFTYNRGSLKTENINVINSYKTDLIISLHCNAATGMATGTEVLYWHSSRKGKEIAGILSDNISKALQLKNRGAKAKNIGDRGSYLLQKTNAPCVILEPFFIDNDFDLKVGIVMMNEYVLSIVDSINKFFNIDESMEIEDQKTQQNQSKTKNESMAIFDKNGKQIGTLNLKGDD